MVQVYALHQVQNASGPYLCESRCMIEVSEEVKISRSERLQAIGMTLKEIRFSEGKNQDEYVGYGATRKCCETFPQDMLIAAAMFHLPCGCVARD